MKKLVLWHVPNYTVCVCLVCVYMCVERVVLHTIKSAHTHTHTDVRSMHGAIYILLMCFPNHSTFVRKRTVLDCSTGGRGSHLVVVSFTQQKYFC